MGGVSVNLINDDILQFLFIDVFSLHFIPAGNEPSPQLAEGDFTLIRKGAHGGEGCFLVFYAVFVLFSANLFCVR